MVFMLKVHKPIYFFQYFFKITEMYLLDKYYMFDSDGYQMI